MRPSGLGTSRRAQGSPSGPGDDHSSRSEPVNPLACPPRRDRATACLAILAWLLVGYTLGRFSFVIGETGATADLGLLSSAFVALWMTPEIWPSPSRKAVLGFRVAAIIVPAVVAMVVALVA